jgi:hypothetical protein
MEPDYSARKMKDVAKIYWYKMQSQQHKRRNISCIYIFDQFPDDEKRQPTCIEDCQQETRRAWLMKRQDKVYAKQAITMIYDSFLELCKYLHNESCLDDKYFKDFTDMAGKAKDYVKYNWALHEFANQLDIACDKLTMLADSFEVTKGGEK